MGSKVTAKAVNKEIKKVKDAIPETMAPVTPKIEEKPREEVKVQKAATMRGCGCCPVELAPLAAGQKYFEAPDGHVILGESERGQVMDRRLNKGRGGWINPMR